MKAYELLFIVAPSIDEETRGAVMARIESTIAEGKGTVDNVDNTLIDFHADPAEVAELDRVLRITDAVVRHMIVKRTDRD